MVNLKVYNAEGEEIDEIKIELDETLAERGNEVLALALRRQAANARRPYAHTKTRSNVRGGGAKPWRQKGTGRARHGSRRSPIWVGGGITFGPSKERNFTKGMNRKERKLAMRKVMYNTLTDGKVMLVDSVDFKEPSTKRGVKLLTGAGCEGRTLFVHNYSDKGILRSFTNIPRLTMYAGDRLNAFDLLVNDHILVTKDEFEKIRERWID